MPSVPHHQIPHPPSIVNESPYVDYHDYSAEEETHSINNYHSLPPQVSQVSVSQVQTMNVEHTNLNLESEDLNVWSAEDKMNKICSKLGITSGIHIGVKLYGFNQHLDVYEEIWRLTFIDDAQRRESDVRVLNTNRLRDIKCKIKSEGKTGKKKEMIEGVLKRLVEFREFYQTNQYAGEHSEFRQQEAAINASYQCDVCNKVFSRNSDLTVHRRTHSGEKQFKCNQCGKLFRDKKKYKKHQKKHKK